MFGSRRRVLARTRSEQGSDKGVLTQTLHVAVKRAPVPTARHLSESIVFWHVENILGARCDATLAASRS